MKILNKLTKKDLKLNKKRTIGTIIGIVLATALITVVGGMFYVLQNTLVEETVNTSGYYHIAINNIDNNEVLKIKDNKDFSNMEIIKNLGYIKPNIGEDNTYSFYSMDNKTRDYLKYKLLNGSFPKNNKEILVNDEFNRIYNTNIGSIISFNVNGNNKDYKIVGTINTYGVIITSFEESNDNFIYLTLKHPNHYKKDISNLLEVSDYEIETSQKYSYSINKELLMWEVFAVGDNVKSFIYSALYFVIGIILVTSVFSIRNSFAISVNEKMKTYGILASLGASKKQIRRMVLLEGFYLGIIGISIGLILGNGITYLLTLIINLLAKNANMVSSNNFLYYKFSILPTYISIIVSIIMIFLSTISGSIKASLVSPIQNIRNSDNIKNAKKLKVPFYIRKIFKIGGILSYKNLKRSKKKYRVTVISLTVSIFVFILVSSFIEYGLMSIKNNYGTVNYDLLVEDLYEVPNSSNEKKLTSFAKSHVSYIEDDRNEFHNYKVEANNNTYSGAKYNDCSNYDIYGNCTLESENLLYKLNIYDNNSFKEYLKELDIDYEKNKDKIIVIDYLKENKKLIRRTDYKVDDKIVFKDDNNYFTYDIASITNTRPWGLEDDYSSRILFVVNKDYYKGFGNLVIDNIYYETDNPKELENNLYDYNSDLDIYNISEYIKQSKTIIIIFSIFIYGFIIVVTLIGITSVFNTINSNMELRRREFATLKSIGMTKKEFNNMILLEAIFYSLKSLTIGIIIGLLGSRLVYDIFKKDFDYGYLLPLKPIIISIIFIILLVYGIMKYSINKLNKENIIETIRKENI